MDKRENTALPPKPVPVVASWSRPYWAAAKEGRLTIQQCTSCNKHVFYPRMVCPHCAADSLVWVEASGKGTVYSYTVVEANAPSAFLADMPFVIAVIRLEEGVQMLSNVIGCAPHTVKCDMPVQVTFEKLDGEFTLPKFKPV